MTPEKQHTNEYCRAFTGGRIITMDPSNPEVDLVIFRDGRIIAAGDHEVINRYPVDEVTDLRGRVLIPGFIDSHLHVSFGCFLPEWVDLTGCRTREDILLRLKDHTSDPEKKWIVGFPWYDPHYGGPAITRQDLDSVSSEKPVILIHTTFHSLVGNTQAFREAGITRELQSSGSGLVFKDEEGELTGLLMESACVPVLKCALGVDTRKYAELIENAARDLHRFGITAVHDPGVTPGARAAYSLLKSENRLPVSVLMMPHGETLLDNRVRHLKEAEYGSGDEMLRVGPVKVFGDGGNKETTAISVKVHGQTMAGGKYRDDFRDTIIDATQNGYQVCVHCLGNLTVDAVLDSFQAAMKSAPRGFCIRPRLEHLNLLSPEQIDRLSSMNACASIQPQFLMHAGLLNKVPIEGDKWFAYADLLNKGVTLGGSSDHPGGFMDGRDVIACCCLASTMSDGRGNELSGDQKMPFEKWLNIYTAGSAYIGGQENERGMIREGLVADFVILDGDLDPFSPPVVDETWIAGRLVYHRPEMSP